MKNMALMDPGFLVKLAIKELLRQENIKICGMLSRYQALQIMLDDNVLDILVIELFDDNFQLLDGINFIKRNKQHWKKVKLIILTGVEIPFLIKTAMKFKPSAIVSKRDSEAEINFAIKQTISSKTYCSPEIHRLINDASHQSLTVRELHILTLLVGGAKMTQVSAILDISYKTVHAHKYNIIKKSGVNDLSGFAQIFRWELLLLTLSSHLRFIEASKYM